MTHLEFPANIKTPLFYRYTKSERIPDIKKEFGA